MKCNTIIKMRKFTTTVRTITVQNYVYYSTAQGKTVLKASCSTFKEWTDRGKEVGAVKP